MKIKISISKEHQQESVSSKVKQGTLSSGLLDHTLDEKGKKEVRALAAKAGAFVRFWTGDRLEFIGPKKAVRTLVIDHYNDEKVAKLEHPELFK